MAKPSRRVGSEQQMNDQESPRRANGWFKGAPEWE